MFILKDCPECGKPLSKSRKYCKCGWKIGAISECQIDGYQSDAHYETSDEVAETKGDCDASK